jgi:hypothetical protein
MAYKVKYSKPENPLNQNNEELPGNWIDAREEYVFI